MASIWELFVRLSGDPSNFKKAVKDSSDALTGFEKLADSAGAKILGALSFAGLAAGALHSAEKFQEAGFSIARSTGATGARLDGLNEAFKHLYSTSATSADKIAESLATIARETGTSGAELEKLTKANMQFAKVTGTDVAQAIDSTQIIFKQWGVTASEQAAKLDVLYKIQTLTGISTQALGEEMAATGATMRALGFSFNESVAFVGAFEEAGLKASDMVRGLNAAFIKWAEAGKDPKQALADLIEKLKDTKSAAAATRELIEAGFSSRSVIAMADAAKRGALEITGLTSKLDEASGVVSEMAKNTTTLGAEMTKMWRNIEAGLTTTGPGFLGWITRVIAKMNEAIPKGNEFMRAMSLGEVDPKDIDGSKMAALNARNLKGQTFGAPATTGGGGASGGIPGTLKFADLSQMVSAEALSKIDAGFKAMVATLAEWNVNGRKVETTASAISKVLDVQANVTLPSVAQSVEVVVGTFDDALSPAIKRSEELMHALGITSTRELRAQYLAARQSTEALILMNSSQEDVTASAAVMAEKYKALSERLGNWDNQAKVATKTGINFAQQVSTAVTDLGKSLTAVLFKEKEIGEAFKDVGKTIVRVILEDIIGIGIGKLMGALGGLSKTLGGILGTGGGLVGTGSIGGGIAGGIPSSLGLGSSSGGAGGAASSLASSGIGSIIGLVTGGIQAASSVVANFQFAGMNKSLDFVVKHTLQTANDLANLRRDAWDQHNGMRAIQNMIYDRMGDILGTLRSGGTGAGGSGKGGITFNACTFTGSPDQIANAIFTQASLAGF